MSTPEAIAEPPYDDVAHDSDRSPDEEELGDVRRGVSMRILQVQGKKESCRVAAHVAEKGHAQEHQQPPGVGAQQRDEGSRDTGYTLRAVSGRLEAVALRQSSAQRDDQDQRNQSERVQTAPAIRDHINETKHQRSDSVAYRGQRAEQPDCPSPYPRVDLLDQNHQRHGCLRARERARQDLENDEGALVGRESTQSGERRVAKDRVEQELAATEDIRERSYQQRKQVAEPDQRRHHAESTLGDPESLLNLLQRQAQQGAIVLIEETRGYGDRKHAPLAACEFRGPSEQAEVNTPALFVARWLSGNRGLSFTHRACGRWEPRLPNAHLERIQPAQE